MDTASVASAASRPETREMPKLAMEVLRKASLADGGEYYRKFLGSLYLGVYASADILSQ
jgi:hypothetical protein